MSTDCSLVLSALASLTRESRMLSRLDQVIDDEVVNALACRRDHAHILLRGGSPGDAIR